MLEAHARYLNLLIEANQTMNLTRITDRAAAEIQHIGDSLTLLPFLKGAKKVIDVGSGGGAPGIPLAIALPDVKFTLLEATKKKAVFLERAVQQLDLANVTVVAQRAEEAGQSALRESFDVVVVRAVGTMNWLAEWCLPLVRRRGKMLAMKGPKVVDELPMATRAIQICGGGAPKIHPVELAGTTGHVIVEIQKLERTDKRYPRLPSVTRGNPIR